MDRQMITGAFFVDLKKAFYLVEDECLLFKVEHYRGRAGSPGGGGGGRCWGTPYNGLYGKAPPEGKASDLWKGRDFTRWSIWKSKEVCHLGQWKGP